MRKVSAWFSLSPPSHCQASAAEVVEGRSDIRRGGGDDQGRIEDLYASTTTVRTLAIRRTKPHSG